MRRNIFSSDCFLRSSQFTEVKSSKQTSIDKVSQTDVITAEVSMCAVVSAPTYFVSLIEIAPVYGVVREVGGSPKAHAWVDRGPCGAELPRL
jgi:hypothetical protein